MQDRRVRGVDAAFQCLQPIAFLDHLGDVAARLGHLGPGEFGWRRHLFGRAEIGPDDPAELRRRIGGDVDTVLELVLWRLIELVDAIAFDVVFPAVIDAAQPALLVAPEKQRHPPVRTELVDQADAALAVAERHEVLTQQPDPHGRAVGLGDLACQAGRDPIPPHRVAHRAALPDAGDQFVFLGWQHGRLSPHSSEPAYGRPKRSRGVTTSYRSFADWRAFVAFAMPAETRRRVTRSLASYRKLSGSGHAPA